MKRSRIGYYTERRGPRYRQPLTWWALLLGGAGWLVLGYIIYVAVWALWGRP